MRNRRAGELVQGSIGLPIFLLASGEIIVVIRGGSGSKSRFWGIFSRNAVTYTAVAQLYK